jgi:hypothetical protein
VFWLAEKRKAQSPLTPPRQCITRKEKENMSKHKQARTTPKIAGTPIYGEGNQTASPGNFVYKHDQKYHVFVGLKKVLVTEDRELALTEAARTPAL